jgi:hypothetical protein
LPDRYGYDYGSIRIEPSQSGTRRPPTFACEAHGPVSIPRAVPRIVWRLCLDLHPVDLSSGHEVVWLETLVWPGRNERVERLRGANSIAQTEPPKVIRGDLLTDLEPLIAAAPRNATLVVFHTAALAYVRSPANRRRFAEVVRASRAVWISNEAPGVSPLSRTRLPPLHRQSASSWRSTASPSLDRPTWPVAGLVWSLIEACFHACRWSRSDAGHSEECISVARLPHCATIPSITTRSKSRQ